MSATADLLLSLSEQNFISTGCATNCRGDGRTATEFRRCTITTPGPIPLSHGSARLTSADGLQTMLCSVKAELVAPSQHQPRHGLIVVSVDQHGAAGASNRSQLRESQVALQQRLQWVNDLTTLCVVPGAAVWRLHVDLLVIFSSAITTIWSLDAASHCIRHALANTVLPAMEIADEAVQDQSTTISCSSKSVLDRLIVNSDIALARPAVTIESVPFLITVHLIPVPSSTTTTTRATSPPWCWILDATPEEQAVAVAAVHVAVRRMTKAPSPTRDQQSQSVVVVTAVWKSGAGSVPLHLLPTVVQTAVDAVETAQESYRLVVTTERNNGRPPAAASNRQWLEGPLLIQ